MSNRNGEIANLPVEEAILESFLGISGIVTELALRHSFAKAVTFTLEVQDLSIGSKAFKQLNTSAKGSAPNARLTGKQALEAIDEGLLTGEILRNAEDALKQARDNERLPVRELAAAKIVIGTAIAEAEDTIRQIIYALDAHDRIRFARGTLAITFNNPCQHPIIERSPGIARNRNLRIAINHPNAQPTQYLVRSMGS